MVNCKNGHKRLARGRILKSRRHPWGYHWFEFSVAGVRHCDFGHRLVMEAFVGPCPEGYYVLHGDNTPSNNRLANLRYGTPTENCEDKLMHGTQPAGELISWHKLKEKDVVAIRCRRANDESLASIGKDYNLPDVYVWHICAGKKWPNAGGPLTEAKRVVRFLTDSEKLEVKKKRAEGATIQKLAEMFDVSRTQIHNLVRMNNENQECQAA